MKTTLKKGTAAVAIILFILCTVGAVLRAQTDVQNNTDNPLQPASLDTIQNGTTFYRLSDYLTNGGSFGPPWPFLMDTNVPVYSLNGNALLVDDSSIASDQDLANALSLLVQPKDQFSANLLGGGTMMAADSIDPTGGDTNSTGTVTNYAQYTPFVPPTNGLWLEILPIGTNSYNTNADSVTLILHNTLPDEPYEIISREVLNSSNWTSEGFVFGDHFTNWTVTTVPIGTRTNSLFFSARWWLDSAGIGIPDWWQEKYFGMIGIDPNADPDNDGVSNLQEFENGTDPTVFDMPSAPSNFIAILGANGTNVMVSWQSSAAAVQYYTLGRYTFNSDTFQYDYTSFGQISNNVTSFRDVGAVTNDDPWDTYYALQATYASGSTPTETADISSDVPIPQGFAVSFNIGTGVATLNWLPSPGLVTGYTVLRQDTATSGFSAIATVSDTTYEDDSVPSGDDVEYEVEANYDDGNSPPTDPKNPRTQANYTVSGSIVRGAQGTIYLLVPAIPEGITNIRVYRTDTHQSYYPLSTFKPLGTGMASVYSLLPSELFSAGADGSFDIAVSAFTNGIYQLSTSEVPMYGTYRFQVQGRGSNGQFGDKVDTGYVTGDPGRPDYIIPFFDGRANIAQNITFLLRTSQTNFPFFTRSEDYDYQVGANWGYSGHFDYVYAGFHFFDYTRTNDFVLNEFQPFEENHYYLNYCYEGTNVSVNTYGYLNTGAYSPGGTFDTNGDDIWYYETSAYWTTSGHPPTSYFFDTAGLVSGTSSPSLSPVLSSDATRWILFLNGPFDLYNTNYYIPAMNNVYGLPLQTFKWPGGNTPPYSFQTANIGDLTDLSSGGDWFREFGQPTLTTNSYYFAQHYVDPLPGEPAFSVTNSTRPLFIASVGKPFSITAWAKQSLQNGYSGVFAYPEQYFDKAYKADTNGNPTATETGILSEYGEFFPTEPGPVVLTTKPDATTGTTGQCTVNVVKIQLDRNHDGAMDLSYAGPDTTSAACPMDFWVNDDSDQMTYTGDPGHDVTGIYATPPDDQVGFIVSKRDLEDYARLWICGLPALPTDQGYSVTLSMSAISGDPAINLVDTVETNGGTAYLTDTNVAQNEVLRDFGLLRMKYPTISATNTLTLPANLFTNAGNKYFLFEGAGVGQGQLTLTISQGTNVLGQSSAWLNLQEVTNLFEEAQATNVTSGKPPSSLISDFSIIKTAPASHDEAKQIIVFVHGINNTLDDYQSTSQTIYKRLYWAGYHGRFASFRWPCAYLPPSTLNPFQYNKGEFYAFKSATALKNYLGYLRNRADLNGYAIDIYAHSQGNVVASEALAQGGTFDNYILTQGAIPAHCYDTNAPFLQKLLDAENIFPTPFYPVDGGYHGYFYGIQGNLIDFENTNDFALSTGTTIGLQTNWEEDQRTEKPEAFLGGPIYSYDPTNHVTTALYVGSSYTVTDSQEIKALVARSRSKAVGAQPGLHGVISSSIDLAGSYGFGNTRDEHSAQFVRPIQTVLPYYRQMLTSFQILP